MKLKSKTNPEDQRRFRRYSVNFPCTIRPRKAKKNTATNPLLAETRDVSSGGFFFSVSAEWAIGTEIECELRLPVKAFGGTPIGIFCRGKIARQTESDEGKIGYGATIDHYEFFHVRDGARLN
jgi:hypothetical protein